MQVKLTAKGSLNGKLNNPTIREYPELEDITITPTTEEQHLKSEKYGYGNITVEAIEDTNAKVLSEIEGLYLSSASNQLVRYITDINEDLVLTSKNGAWLFYNMNNLQYIKSIDLTNANGTLGLKGLFSYCTKLKFGDIKIKGLDVSKVSDISNFFENCYLLTWDNLVNVFDIYN